MADIPELFDSHTHIDFPDYDADRAEVVARAQAAGVRRMVCVGTDVAASRIAIGIAAAHAGVYASAGIHPNHVAQFPDSDLDALASLARDPAVVAIGETGLDFFRNETPRDRQELFFHRQLELAAETGKAFILHSRQSGMACLDIVEQHMKTTLGLRGVFHCFTDTKEVLLRALELGLHVGVSGIATFPKGDNVRECVPLIPADRLVLDTDCPFLTPPPHRGARNEPAHAVLIARQLSVLRGISYEQFAAESTAAAAALFGLPASVR